MAHNLHENDSMLAVGEAPWHGLGVTLATPPESSRQALEIAGLDWNVTKRSLFIAKDGQFQPVKVAGAVSKKNDGSYGAIVREDTGDILGVVGPGYRPFQNVQMADLFQPLVEEGTLSIETVGSLFNGRRVWMLGRFGSNEQIDNGHDEIGKYLLLAHGHDGQFAVRFGFTPIRVVCWNTLTAATAKDSESKLIRCLHTSGLQENLESLREAMVQGEEVFALTAEQFRSLAKRGVSRVDLREYARIVVEADADQRKWTPAEQRKISLIVRNAVEGRGNRGQNWWHAYNGVTEYVCHNASRTQDRRLDEAWWGSGQKLSRRALEQALLMAGVA